MNESRAKKTFPPPEKKKETLPQKPPLNIKGIRVNRTHVKGPKDQPSLVADARILFFTEGKKKKDEQSAKVVWR